MALKKALLLNYFENHFYPCTYSEMTRKLQNLFGLRSPVYKAVRRLSLKNLELLYRSCEYRNSTSSDPVDYDRLSDLYF